MKRLVKVWKDNPATRFILILLISIVLIAAVGTTIDDFFLPGSQPGQSGNIEHPDKCDNCHGGYDLNVEPAFNWRGSMMAQAQRDPLYQACLAIANQDAPESGDLCIRCHAPDGWLNGRSEPTDGSALNNNDYEGVQCDFCHKLVKPYPLGENPFPNDPDYTNGTFQNDQNYLSILSEIPLTSANGMYIASDQNAKRGPYADAEARHQQLYSPFHSESAICGTCHDVSNPAFSRTGDIDKFGSPVYAPNSLAAPAPNFDQANLFPIERTYSEWLISDFNSESGVLVDGFSSIDGTVSTCQDCHMRDVIGFGCNKKGAPLREDLPLHDMTGGNTFVPGLVSQLYPGDVDQAAIDAGILRAKEMLQKAASMELSYTGDPLTGMDVKVKITNKTGHKLPSGYPEGRRIWINLAALNAAGDTLFVDGAYNFETADLSPETKKIYEIKPGIGPNIAGEAGVGVDEGVSFHFVLNNMIYKDNRIPPLGATEDELASIQSPVIGASYPGVDGQNWDETTYHVTIGNIDKIVAKLYYQTLSKEYVTFLRDENVTNDAGRIMYDLWNNNGKSAPEVMVEEVINFGESPVAPVAEFSAEPTNGTAPLTVQFTDQSTNSPAEWLWDFGDGSISTATNPIHTYTVAGTYTVKLVVSNDAGDDTSTKTDLINVQEGNTSGMNITSIAFSQRLTARGGKEYVEVSLSLTDDQSAPVDGADISVVYSGPTSGTVNGITDIDGSFVFTTRSSKNAGVDWCVDQVSAAKAGFTFNGVSGLTLPFCESSVGARYASDLSLVKGAVFSELKLYQNYPNPFSSQTTIRFDLPSNSSVTLSLFDTQGKLIGNLMEGKLDAGQYTYNLQFDNLPAGQYLLKLLSDDQLKSHTLIKVD